nr:uncharacterized protein LOC112013276 [Quercus suber]POF20505.1 hypothetical protein CFP56_63171 [Quercus suber]
MECEFSVRERSREEDAELQRSTKKVKDSATAFASEPPPSYKDKLVGEIPGAFAQAFNLDPGVRVLPGPEKVIGELSKGLMTVNLTPETRDIIRAKWVHALIVKVHGRSVGFQFLHSKLMSMWKPAGRMDCVDLDKDFYLIRFGLVEDYDNVLKGGPWFVGGHFLNIRVWEPNFKPSTAVCNMVAVWIRFPELPIEFYALCVLKEIGNAIGPVLRIDSNTAAGARGRYARICVQIDLNKPLVRQILLEG